MRIRDSRLFQRVEDRARDLSAKLPGEKSQKIKLVAAIAILAICVPIIAYQLVTRIDISRPARELDTPAWRIAKDLNLKLAGKEAFRDVEFAVASERPLKFTVSGALHAQPDHDELITFLKEIRPEADYELDVVILR